jgi:hypothetical protein
MPSCPVCGSNENRQIAPNYWECRGTRRVPTGAPPSGAQGAHDRIVACGERYATGATGVVASLCYCGTDSIGTCQRCGTRVCGDHSRLREDSRVCKRCLDIEAEEARIAADAAKIREVQALEDTNARLRAEVSAFLRSMAAAGNPGAIPCWRERPGRFGKPAWLGWPVGVNREARTGNDGFSNDLFQEAILATTGEYLRVQARPKGRPACALAVNCGGLSLRLTEIVATLRVVANEHGVVIA